MFRSSVREFLHCWIDIFLCVLAPREWPLNRKRRTRKRVLERGCRLASARNRNREVTRFHPLMRHLVGHVVQCLGDARVQKRGDTDRANMVRAKPVCLLIQRIPADCGDCICGDARTKHRARTATVECSVRGAKPGNTRSAIDLACFLNTH